MDGQAYEDPWGNMLALTPQSQTLIADFFKPEKQYTNNLSVEGGNEKVNYRLSYANTYVDGYVPTNTINKNNFNLRTQASITDKFKLDAKLNYIMQDATNRPTLSDASDNPAYLLISQPRSIPMDIMSEYKWTADDVAKQLGYSGPVRRTGKNLCHKQFYSQPFLDHQ